MVVGSFYVVFYLLWSLFAFIRRLCVVLLFCVIRFVSVCLGSVDVVCYLAVWLCICSVVLLFLVYASSRLVSHWSLWGYKGGLESEVTPRIAPLGCVDIV